MLKDYYVDFGSWIVTAESEDKAKAKAEERLKDGEVPPIADIDYLGVSFSENN